MRKIILMMPVSMMPVSADGFIEGPEREPDWHKVGDELHRHFSEQLGAMGAFLMGRVTFPVSQPGDPAPSPQRPADPV